MPGLVWIKLCDYIILTPDGGIKLKWSVLSNRLRIVSAQALSSHLSVRSLKALRITCGNWRMIHSGRVGKNGEVLVYFEVMYFTEDWGNAIKSVFIGKRRYEKQNKKQSAISHFSYESFLTPCGEVENTSMNWAHCWCFCVWGKWMQRRIKYETNHITAFDLCSITSYHLLLTVTSKSLTATV